MIAMFIPMFTKLLNDSALLETFKKDWSDSLPIESISLIDANVYDSCPEGQSTLLSYWWPGST